MTVPKMSVEAIMNVLEAEVRQMTPEERAALVNNVARLKKLAQDLAEEKRTHMSIANHIGC